MVTQIIRAYPIPLPEEQHNAPRHESRFGEATLESDVFLEKVPVVDVGRLGFSVRTTVTYPQGSRLILHLPGLAPLPARAVWHARNRLGAHFDAPVDIATLFSLIEEA